MKKIFSLFVSLILVILLVSGCGISKTPNEDELKNMLRTQYPECLERYIYKEEVFEINDFEILRRQTNIEEKTDKVDCKLVVENEFYEGVFKYTLFLNYYDDGGWQLDNYEYYDADEMKAKTNTLPTESIENEVDYYNDIYGELSFLEESYDFETGIITRKYTADNKFNYLNVSGNLIIQYTLCEEEIEGSAGCYYWIPEYFDNIEQKWELSKKYKFDAEPQKYSWELDFNDQIPKIFGADGDGEDIAKGIAYIKVNNITNEKIEVTLDIISRDYDGGFSFDDFSTKNITFDIKENVYIQRIFSNREGDYINLILDSDRGICVEEYSYENNKKYNYEYVPY